MQSPLSVIQGGRSFNSGRPVPNNSFLYTFDEMGTYCVASQGAPGYAGVVNVLVDGKWIGVRIFLAIFFPILKLMKTFNTFVDGYMTS